MFTEVISRAKWQIMLKLQLRLPCVTFDDIDIKRPSTINDIISTDLPKLNQASGASNYAEFLCACSNKYMQRFKNVAVENRAVVLQNTYEKEPMLAQYALTIILAVDFASKPAEYLEATTMETILAKFIESVGQDIHQAAWVPIYLERVARSIFSKQWLKC